MLYHLREVRDVLAYLRLAVHDDPPSLTLILNAPPRGIGPVALRKLRGGQAFVTNAQLDATLAHPAASGLSTRALQGLRELKAVLTDLTARAQRPPAELIAHLLNSTGYIGWLQDEVDGMQRLQPLRNLAREAEGYGAIQDFLAFIDRRIAEDFERPEEAGVTLATIHAVKGLEFRVVFVVGMNEGLLPYHRSAHGAAEAGEQRLAHVAITRARDAVYLVSARSRLSAERGGRRDYPMPSRYLARLPSAIVQRETWPP